MTNPPVSRYQQVADRLRQAIIAGEYQPGQPLPSESALAEQYDLNRTTINKAVRLLAVEGLVTVEHGRGAFVRAQRPLMHVSASYVTQAGDQQRASWRSEAERLGMRGTQQLIHVGEVAAPDDIAHLLGLEPGSIVAVRQRTMLLDDEPVQLADSYYPLDLVTGTPITQSRKLPGGTVAALERLGLELGDFEERVMARAASPEERRTLRLSEGVPVLVLIRTTYTTNGRPVEVSRAILTADRHQLSYRLPARA
ncbi:MAG TPA: GntR family transcriptional regulator [Pseudonocardiaceae bacterium]|jgi:GntR family transcriptional regulator|nr:GntR family transcriptional regulator [Pseudonocardiaceae bacterium]